jgi:(1->4)-alpha-D-glucan 1-alpha-D-glucosylmutase
MGVLVEPDGLRALGKAYANFTHEPTHFPTIAHDRKLAVTQEALGSDVNRLTNILIDLCESHREYRDFTRSEVRRAIREVASCFSVYRTYVIPDRDEVTEEDLRVIECATQCAKDNRTDIDGALFDFMRDVLSLKLRGDLESEFVYRFQQFTSPVMAKGVEDTAFYDYNRLTAMNEVGANPASDGISVASFHAYNDRMQRTHPATMTTLSTHDTKRSDDVRARLAVLTEVHPEFVRAVKSWSKRNKQYHHGALPDHGTEWFLYQTLIGTWPIDAQRLKDYMQKAMREGKTHTSWVSNNEEYEKAVAGFIDSILADEGFVHEVEAFLETILYAGRVNSLTQTLLKYTAPGVPDLYQGSELWDLSLVDPDNRRPVDYELRAKGMREIQKLTVDDVLQRMDEGLPKLWLVHHALRLRFENRNWFDASAAYTAMLARGQRAENVIAFRRGEHVVTVVPRCVTSIKDSWADTTLTLPDGEWRNVFSDESCDGGDRKVGDLLRKFPVALLVRAESAKREKE